MAEKCIIRLSVQRPVNMRFTGLKKQQIFMLLGSPSTPKVTSIKQKKKSERNYSTIKNSQLLLLGDDEVSEGPEAGKGADAVAGPEPTHTGPDCVDHARVVGSRHERQRGALLVLALHLEEIGEVEAGRRDSHSDCCWRRDLRHRVVPRDRGERGGFAAGGQRGVAQPPHHERPAGPGGISSRRALHPNPRHERSRASSGAAATIYRPRLSFFTSGPRVLFSFS